MGYCGGDLMAMEGERERLVIGGLADARQGVAHQLTSTTGWLLVS